MIIDSLQNAGKYESLHPLFAKAFDYLRTNHVATAEPYRADIDGDSLKIILAEKKGMTAAESVSKFECHDKYIDIQVCLSGTELIGWKPRSECQVPKGEYNPEKDVRFYAETPDMFFTLRAGQFAIFFPEDVHAPMIGDDVIKKAVFKVKI